MSAAGIATQVRSAISLVVLPTVIFLHSLAAIALALLGRSPRQVHRVYVSAGRTCVFLGGTELVVHGEEHIDPEQAYVVVANHESNWDPVCIVATLRQLVIRAVAKAQFMDIPVLGHALRLTGNVRVVRNQTAGDRARIEEVMGRRDPDVSILFYAEGHRSRDGALHPFKMGAFATALGFGLPILPVAVAGMRPLWRPGTPWLVPGTAAIEIGAPLPVDGLRWEDRHALRNLTFETVRALRTRARARLREHGIEPGGID